MKLIIDCMGGDNAPREMLKGAAAAKAEFGGDYILVGPTDALLACAAENGIDLSGFELLNAEDVVTMNDDPLCVTKDKKESSMAVALRALRDGVGDALVSPGNTGALFAGASLVIRRMKGVHRAAIGAILPFGDPCLLMDAGANVTVQPEFLPQFAVMGTAYMKAVFGMEAPRVGMLNNGTESCKGTPLQTTAYGLLAETAGINWIGNVEPGALPFGACDVAVCDGFTGNICVKAYEGLGKYVLNGLKGVFMTNADTQKAAAVLAQPLSEFKKSFDPSELGGSPILGLNKPVIKAHGSCDARMFRSAIRQAVRLCESGALDDLRAAMAGTQ
ncbi:MAG: phosphate acyltransferase PlsX [Clostridia bacterium]|nr:phosphate acyltransferase PlsX [Clostridia bacterium]